MPKRTFTPVHGLDRNLGYPQIYIDVRWCLYPGIPSLNKNVKSYYRVLNRYADEKFIEVVEHEKCLCNQAHSPAGYRGGSRGKSDRCKLIIVMELLGGPGMPPLPPPPGKFSILEPWKHHLLLSAQLFLSNLAACYSSNFT